MGKIGASCRWTYHRGSRWCRFRNSNLRTSLRCCWRVIWSCRWRCCSWLGCSKKIKKENKYYAY
uniref:OrfA3 n=2 Tax=Enterococcus faecium TaxID=1352 RepID=A7BIW1_ENTFC|nr:unnamed protein product [Enterococcus faecium]BAR94726.1 hypothetical protein [Enterococcus faecium]